MSFNWDVDGSESRLCFPHSADVGSLQMQGRFRYTDMDGEVSDWEEVANFIQHEDSGDISVFPAIIRACDNDDWSSIQLEISLFVQDIEGHKQLVMHPDDDGYTGTFGINAHLLQAQSTIVLENGMLVP